MEFKEYRELHTKGALKTPAYIFNIDVLRERISFIREHLPGMGICYAMKANPFLVADAAPWVDSLEICSPGEERICEKAHIPSGKMVLSGVNKESADFIRIMEYLKSHEDGKRPICTVESLQQMSMLEDAAAKVYGTAHAMDVLLRVTTGNQFGMDEADVLRLARERAAYPHLHVIGLQLFSGTQKKLRTMQKEIADADRLLGQMKEDCGFTAERFEYGPGLPVSYFKKEKPICDEELLTELRKALNAMNFKGEISLEMGRYIAASCGSYITKIMDAKKNRDVSYLICDGGIHQVNYFGQMMAMKLPYMLDKGGEVPLPDGSKEQAVYTICGSLCTFSDVIVKEVPLHHPEVDDILVFNNVGAYSVTEGISLFLSRDLPRVYRMEGGELRQIREKIQTEEFNYG